MYKKFKTHLHIDIVVKIMLLVLTSLSVLHSLSSPSDCGKGTEPVAKHSNYLTIDCGDVRHG